MPISRFFTSPDDATAAVEALKRAGYERVGIHVFGPAGLPPSVDGMVTQGIPRIRAAAYAERVSHGETLVTVNAPLGTGTEVTEILGRHGSGEAGAASVTYEHPYLDPATPFSSTLQVRVLSDNPAPLSSLLNMPLLTADQGPKAASFGMPLLLDEPAPLSKRLGLRLLLDKAAPFSAWIKMRLLWDDPTFLSSRLGWRVLSPDPAPLSRRVGWKLLSDDPAPLSSFFRLPVLSGNPAPLSSLLGWRVLARRRSGPA